MALPILQDHGDIPSLGFRFGGRGLFLRPQRHAGGEPAALAGLDVWIVDALRYTPAPEPFQRRRDAGLDRADQARRAILTNMQSDLDYEATAKVTPDHVRAGI